jgi:hypothetical protein
LREAACSPDLRHSATHVPEQPFGRGGTMAHPWDVARPTRSLNDTIVTLCWGIAFGHRKGD